MYVYKYMKMVYVNLKVLSKLIGKYFVFVFV